MAYNTIILKNYSDHFEEFKANATITPGMLLNSMESDNVRAHPTAGGNCLPIMFACEDGLQGKEIHDNYAAGDKVKVWLPLPGDIVYAILADGQHVHNGDPLESAGTGYLQAHSADKEAEGSGYAISVYPKQIVGIALENKNLSGESSAVESEGTLGTNQRIQVRIV
jgi:hypothetical protein